ncbi:hypothetical protein F511_27924 [Dorcoceras hygrometricum]|uniref:Dystroglycan-like n=1 Tax=Dorcoceras hygrometricum TaxID=472368 RepID=A0A2Z7A827_9LAMI|nr:hypothetical protein F511_27924 [Dorcoceras hygrometricum]
MASSFYSNSQHVDFESVLSMDDQGMVSMFKALMASGLAGFLGCPAVIYEDALVDFFENASVRDGVIFSIVAGQLVEISEEWFAESFELPVDGLGDLSEIPKDAIFDDRSIVSLSGEPISLSGRKNQMKFEFRLLCDIMAKAISNSQEDILLEIPVDVPLPSAGMEITKIVMGKTIKIPGVTKWTWFLNSLPRIPADDNGKEILVEKDPIKGNPAQEHFFLICADIDLLVALRAKVIDDVALFLNSFSLKKLATINIEEMCKKEEIVLSWGETESPQEAIQRKSYILIKYREVLVRKFLESWRANFVPGQGSTAVDLKVINLLTDLHLSILEELVKEARAHGLLWKKPCCSTIFEGSPRDRGAIIARNNTHTPSNVQFSLDQRPSSPTTADSSSSLRFDTIDVDATASSLPPVSQDVSADLQIGNSKLLNRTPAAAVCGGAPSRAHARRATCALAEANAGRVSCDLAVWSSAGRRSWSARLHDDAHAGRVSGCATAPHDCATPCVCCCVVGRGNGRLLSAASGRATCDGCAQFAHDVASRALPPRFRDGGAAAGRRSGESPAMSCGWSEILLVSGPVLISNN